MPRTKKKYNERIDLGYDAAGNRVRKWIRADSAAEFKELKKQYMHEISLTRNPSDITFEKYSDKWFNAFKSVKPFNTQKMYKDALKKCSRINQMRLKDIISMDLQLIIDDDIQHPRTCQKLKLVLSQIFRQAVKDGIIPYNPAEELEVPMYVPKESRFITEEELDIIDGIELEPQDRLYIDVLRNTGMRPSEALALQWVDISADKIHVHHALDFPDGAAHLKTTKTGAIRDIPISKTLYDKLNKAQKRGLFVFCVNGHPFNRSDFSTMSTRILTAINRAFGGNRKMNLLNGLCFYSFRHTFATELYYNGVRTGLLSMKQAAKIMGHSEEVFIKRYTHIDADQENIKEAYSRMKCVQ